MRDVIRGTTWTVLAVIGALGIGAPHAAFAFGGVFTPDRGATTEPVELELARVVFEVDPGQITAHVSMGFVGTPDELAWVLPVTDVPTVEESSYELMAALEHASGLSVRMPASEPCLEADATPDAETDANGCGCGGSTELPGDPALLAGEETEHPPVRSYGTTMTTSYEVETIGAATSSVLIDGLRARGFAVSDNMAPAMDRYNRVGMKFVLIRLRNDARAQQIAPLALTYPGDAPTIPLALTSVSARPHFGLLVTVLGDTTFTPRNFVAVAPSTNEILFDDAHRVSYFEWTARAAADSAGHLFVSEYIGLNPISAGTRIAGHEIRHLYLSRFFTRISPEHMDDDPVFHRHPDPTYRMNGRLDLITEPSLYTCNELVEERLPSACAFNFCGENGACTVVDGEVGCICAPGDVAERITGPGGDDHVVCAPRELAYGLALDPTVTFDPCADVACGEGACVVKHGRASCDCLPGMTAQLEGDFVVCAETPADAETFGPGAGLESRPMTTEMASNPARGPAYAAAFWVLFGLALRLRRR